MKNFSALQYLQRGELLYKLFWITILLAMLLPLFRHAKLAWEKAEQKAPQTAVESKPTSTKSSNPFRNLLP